MTDKQSIQGSLTDLATRPVGKLLWAYSVPAVVGMLVMSLYNVVDRIFIGQGVGPDAIAGLTLTFPVMNITAALGVLIGAGASSRVSIMLGARDHHGAQLMLGNAFSLMCVVIVVYVSLFLMFIDDILLLFGANSESLPYARDYLLWVLPGMALTNITFTFNNVMRASGYPRKAMLTMIIGAVANVALDPVFIFGFDMGIRGAAIATDVAMGVSAVFVMAHFLNSSHNVHFTRGIYRLRRHIVWGIVSIGAAPSVINFASSFINALVNLSLGNHGGNNAIAAAGIFTTYTSLLCMAIIGITQGMQPIVGYNYGAKIYSRLKKAFWLTAIVSMAITTFGSVAGIAWGHWIARAFTSDEALLDTSAHAFSLALLAFSVVGFQIVCTNFFMAIGSAGKSIILGLVRQVIFLIPLLLILPRMLGLDGVWLSFPTSDVLATVVSLAMILPQLRKLSGGSEN